MNGLIGTLLLVAAASTISADYWDEYTTEEYTTEVYGPQHSPRECPCNMQGLWLDIVLVLDSSSGVSQNDFSSVQALLVGFTMQMKIGQDAGAMSRVAIVNVGKTATRISDLTKYRSNSEVMTDLTSLQFKGDADFNIGAGLVEAQRILDESDKRANARNLVMLFTSRGVNCINSKVGINLAQEDEDPCRIAAHMVEDVNTELMTIALKFHETNEFPELNFGSPCFKAINDLNLMPNMQQLACKANCFCEHQYTQFISPNDQCHRYGECVYPKGIASPFFSAQIGCQLDHNTLADVTNSEKHDFLRAIAINDNQMPYWIGLQWKNGRYNWDTGIELSDSDYTNWARRQPDRSAGDCVFVKQTDGFSLRWVSAKCDWGAPSYYYFCQKTTCDTEHYCA